MTAERLEERWPIPLAAPVEAPTGAEPPSVLPALPTPATPEECTFIFTDPQAIDFIGRRLSVPPELMPRWRRFVALCAEDLVSTNELAIVKIATQLFRTGRVEVASTAGDPAGVLTDDV